MGQMGFFDLANRYSGLDRQEEPLLKIDGVLTVGRLARAS